ncbi:hypothetical protein KI387_007580, partial [Taxus chinensis]
ENQYIRHYLARGGTGSDNSIFGPYARDLTQRGLSFTIWVMYVAHPEETPG